MLFAGDGTFSFVKETSRDFENENPSMFWKNFLRQSQSATPEPVPKKAKMIPFIA